MYFAGFAETRFPEATVPIALGIVAVVVLAICRHRLAGTTLVAPCSWAMFAVALVAAYEAMIGHVESSATRTALAVEPLQFLVATSTFCPIVAVMGARKPHDRAWQLIVFSLWAILCGPAILAMLFRPAVFQVDTIWSYFLLAFVGAGIANYLPTRFWASAILVAAGQILLLGHHLPGLHALLGGLLFEGTSPLIANPSRLGLMLITAAIVLLPLAAKDRGRQGQSGLDQLWVDFRNRFGALWSLRLAERINTSARRYNGTTVLRWKGFQHVPEGATIEASDDGHAMPPETRRALEQDMRNYLRRFVSPEWIEQRLTGP